MIAVVLIAMVVAIVVVAIVPVSRLLRPRVKDICPGAAENALERVAMEQ